MKKIQIIYIGIILFTVITGSVVYYNTQDSKSNDILNDIKNKSAEEISNIELTIQSLINSSGRELSSKLKNINYYKYSNSSTPVEFYYPSHWSIKTNVINENQFDIVSTSLTDNTNSFTINIDYTKEVINIADHSHGEYGDYHEALQQENQEPVKKYIKINGFDDKYKYSLLDMEENSYKAHHRYQVLNPRDETGDNKFSIRGETEYFEITYSLSENVDKEISDYYQKQIILILKTLRMKK